MGLRIGPLVAGIMAIIVGLFLIMSIGQIIPLSVQAQLGDGGVALLVGLYLVLVEARRAPKRGPHPTSPKLSTLLRREVRGRPFRTAATATATAVVIAALFATMLLTSGAANTIESVRNKLGADVIVIPQGTQISQQPFYTFFYSAGSSYVPASLEKSVASIPGVKEVSRELLLTEFHPSGGCGGLSKTYIIAVDPATNLILRSWLPANVSQPLVGNAAIVGAEVPRFHLLPGGGNFYGQRLAVQATLPTTGTFMDHMIFISFDTADKMLLWQQQNGISDDYWLSRLSFQQGQVSDLSVKLQDGANADQVATQVESSITNVHAFTVNSLVLSANVRLSGLLSIYSYAGGIVWLGSVLLTSTATYLAVNERRSEIGVIRAMGGTRSFIRKVIATQSVLLASLAGSVGVIGGLVFFYTSFDSISLTIGIPFKIPPPTQLSILILLALSLAVLTGVVASLWPTRVASRLEPYDAMRRGVK